MRSENAEWSWKYGPVEKTPSLVGIENSAWLRGEHLQRAARIAGDRGHR